MPKTFTSAYDAVFSDSISKLVPIIEAHFDDTASPPDTIYANLSGHDLIWDTQTYIGAGRLLEIGTVEETSEVQAYSLALMIGSTNSLLDDDMANALDVDYRGKPVIVKLAALDDDNQIIADPVVMFAGRMESMEIDFTGSGSITINCVAGLSDWATPHGGRYNHSYQVGNVDSTDLGFEYIAQLKDLELVWGRQEGINTVVSGTSGNNPAPPTWPGWPW